MGKNVSFKKKWVKNLVQFPGSEKNFQKYSQSFKKDEKSLFLQKWVKM